MPPSPPWPSFSGHCPVTVTVTVRCSEVLRLTCATLKYRQPWHDQDRKMSYCQECVALFKASNLLSSISICIPQENLGSGKANGLRGSIAELEWIQTCYCSG